MAQPIMEQCLLTLTEILNSQNNAVRNIRVTIEKRLKYIENFTGKQGTLPSFIATIDQIIEEFGPVNINEVFAVVYNEKIGGIAKNFLAIEAPASWEECKQKLKIHFRPTKDEATILRSINSIKVYNISQLLDKIQNIINYITECATFNKNGLEIANCLNSALILKIKDVTAGALAAEIYNEYNLSKIRTILFKYIGQDEYNLRSDRTHNIEPRNQCQNTTSQNFQNNRHNYTNPNKNNNYTNQYPNRNNNYTNQNQVNRNSYQNQPNGNSPTGQIRNNNASGQARNNGYNNHPQNIQNSGQHRSRQARIEPMEVDYLSNKDETNQIENHEFFIN